MRNDRQRHRTRTDCASFTVRVMMYLKTNVPKYGSFIDIHYEETKKSLLFLFTSNDDHVICREFDRS